MIDFLKIIKEAKYLPGDIYGDYWNEFDKQGIEARKLEFLQSYDFIDGDEDFKKGDYDKFLETLRDFHKKAYGGKDNIRRIHFIKEPLDEYLQMEYYTYLIDESFGQEIRITKDRNLFPDKTYDFVLFENGNLFILDFGNNDCWKGAWHITDEKIISEVADWFDSIFNQSANFKSMMKPNEYIIKQMKQMKII